MTSIETPFALSDAALGEGMSLVVVDEEGVDSEVKVAGEAGDYLADAWSSTLEEIARRELVAYTPEVVIRAGEGRALVINDDLRPENEVVGDLLGDRDRPLRKPRDLSGSLYLYALVSDAPAGRLAMIKKKNPTRRASSGKMLFAADDELRRLGDDPWELHPEFDLVVGEDGAYVLTTYFFEQLFADADRLRQKIGPWVEDFGKRLRMDQTSREALVAACDASPRLRRRLRTIAHRGHLQRVKVADVERHVKEMGLTVTDFVQNGKLVVTEDNHRLLLEVLNEDLTRGGLTRDPFVIESKEPLR